MYRNFDAVIWDFGGVITSSPFEAFARFETANELPKDFIRSINATNPDTNAWALFERSEIDADAFDAAFQAEAAARGHSVRGAEVLALLAGDIRPEMVAVLRAIRSCWPSTSSSSSVTLRMVSSIEPTEFFAWLLASAPLSIFSIT